MKKMKWLLASLVFLVACSRPVETDTQPVVQESSQSQTAASSEESSSTSQEETSKEEGTSQDSQTSAFEETDTVADYFPLIQNYEADFKGDGIEFSSFTRWFDFIDGDFVQYRTNNSGTSVMEVVHVTDEAANVVLHQPEFYVRENYIDRVDPNQVVTTYLKAPLEVGNSWTNGDTSREITAIDAEVELENGETVLAIEVTLTTPYGQDREYFAKEYGLVRQETGVENGSDPMVTSTLESLETDGWTERVQVTQANADATGHVQEEVEIPVQTNTIMREEFRKILSGETGMQALLPEGTDIQSLYTNNRDTSHLYVDFSEEIQNIRGSTAVDINYEAIFRTLADYYYAQYLTATANNGPIEIDQVGPLAQPIEINRD